MTLEQLFEIYCQKRLRDGSANTVRLYKHSIKSFGETLGKPATVDDFSDENVERHMWRLVTSGKSRATANKDHNQLCAMWRFANRNNIVKTWPNVRMLQEPERVPLAWTACPGSFRFLGGLRVQKVDELPKSPTFIVFPA